MPFAGSSAQGDCGPLCAFAGLDVHKKETEAAVIDEAGNVLVRERFATRRETLERFARRHLRECRVALDFDSDPADEIIAATSLAHDIPLLTRDLRIRNSKTVKLA